MKKLASILAVTLAAGVLATGCGSSSGSASKDSSSDSGKTVIKAATGANAKPYVYVGDDDKPAERFKRTGRQSAEGAEGRRDPD